MESIITLTIEYNSLIRERETILIALVKKKFFKNYNKTIYNNNNNIKKISKAVSEEAIQIKNFLTLL